MDTLKGSRHTNMKELRFKADNGVWRVAFAFDPKRQAILLVCGDKSGVNEKKFYDKLIEKADKRFDQHLAQLKVQNKKGDSRGKDIKGKTEKRRSRTAKED